MFRVLPAGPNPEMGRKKSFEKIYETFQYIQTEYGGFGFLVSFAIWAIGWPEMAKIVAKFVFFSKIWLPAYTGLRMSLEQKIERKKYII